MKKIRAGLLGFGTIGTGVVKVFQQNKDPLAERLGAEVRLGQRVTAAEPGEETTNALMARLKVTNLGELRWSAASIRLREQVEFLHRTIGDPWPNWSTAWAMCSRGSVPRG